MQRRKRKPTTSIKAILVRNHNWRMGNLRRIQACALALDSDLAREVQECIHEQLGREQSRHELRLAFLEHNNPMKGGYDDMYESARMEAERNKMEITGDL